MIRTVQQSGVLHHVGDSIAGRVPQLESYLLHKQPLLQLSLHPRCLFVLRDGLGHEPICLESVEDKQTRGCLFLAHVYSRLFGRYLVSLPYFNYGGIVADENEQAQRLLDHAVELAQRLGVKHLELRHAQPLEHTALTGSRQDKVHMRLDLPPTVNELWRQLKASVRNQVRKGQKSGLTISWGRNEKLDAFYAVFAHNMRDLGTPVYSKRLFGALLDQFPDRAEICIVALKNKPVAAALLLHGWGITEVPSASSLRRFNPTCANMLMYWSLLERTIDRGQKVFDFGRSTPDSPTYRFKKQWGAEPMQAHWQYYSASGKWGELRPDNPRFRTMIQLWRKLPVFVTRWIGPPIVRGIP